MAEVEAMDLVALTELPRSATWRGKTRNLFPPDLDRLNEAIDMRKAALKGNPQQ